MAKYKLLTQIGWPECHIEKGKIYDEDYLLAGIKISTHVANYPNDWELVKEFPKKWKINVHSSHAKEIQKWIKETYPYNWSFSNKFYGNASYVHDFDFTGVERLLKDHEEITYEQLLTNVIKTQTNYKIKAEYSEFAHKLLEVNNLITFNSNSIYFNKLFKAGVLDIWCEVAPKYTLPEILGYKGEDLGDSVKYGCQTRKVDWVKRLYKTMQEFDLGSAEIVSDYVVNVDKIRQIVEYFDNKM